MSLSRLLIAAVLAGAPIGAYAQVDMAAPPSEAPPAAEQIQRNPITTMFDNFSISLIAAKTCSAPNEALMTRFVQNLMIVQQVTIQHFRKEMPEKSVDDIVAMLESRVETLGSLVTGSIQSKGCTDPEIAKLVDSFTVNASMDFTKKP